MQFGHPRCHGSHSAQLLVPQSKCQGGHDPTSGFEWTANFAKFNQHKAHLQLPDARSASRLLPAGCVHSRKLPCRLVRHGKNQIKHFHGKLVQRAIQHSGESADHGRDHFQHWHDVGRLREKCGRSCDAQFGHFVGTARLPERNFAERRQRTFDGSSPDGCGRFTICLHSTVRIHSLRAETECRNSIRSCPG